MARTKTVVQLFHPVYRGRYVEVTPRHWWSRLDRKAARLALQAIEYELERNPPAGSYITYSKRVRPAWRTDG